MTDLYYLVAICGHATMVVSGVPARVLEAERQRVLDCLRRRGQTVESLRAELTQKLQRSIESRIHNDAVHGRPVANWVATLCVLAAIWERPFSDRGIIVQMLAGEDGVLVGCCWTVPGQANVMALRNSIEGGRG